VVSLASLELLWLLLPVAAGSGWYLARRETARRAAGRGRAELRSDYFQGINYLLNEQPDKAIEVFIKVLEVDSNTVETHMALGSLYRRRGEVDRAIRIHQNVVARASGAGRQRLEALLELAQDHLSAGLLDRAEGLFQELAEDPTFRVQALRQLIDIYEQEKDWKNAIATARRLEQVTGNQLESVIAHYVCEEAQQAFRQGEIESALALTDQALKIDPACVRASLLEGDAYAERGELDRAVAAYRKVEGQDSAYISESVDRLEACYRAGAVPADLAPYLGGLLARHGGTTTVLMLAELKREQQGVDAAIAFLTDALHERMSVRAIDRLLELEMDARPADSREHLRILKELTTKLLDDRPVYQCTHCGFPARALHWKCPSCKHWNSVKPIQGLAGD